MKRALVHPRAVLFEGDCLRVLGRLGAGTVGAVVTDPPYELGFMGKGWDASGIAFSVDLWREVLRVLKPGSHLLAFGAPRTYHRMACAIEDAGFEIRDSLHWMYGTGFPKSLNGRRHAEDCPVTHGASVDCVTGYECPSYGTALKPGHEPIVLARKPLEGTVAANVAAYGTGALNIDGCRLEGQGKPNGVKTSTAEVGFEGGFKTVPTGLDGLGRWPANVLLDEDAAAELDAQSGDRTNHARKDGRIKTGVSRAGASFSVGTIAADRFAPTDSGGASRFFYVAKPSRRERDLGCEHLPAKSGGEATDREDGSKGTENPRAGAGRTGGARNFHPTVKPVELMRYLCRLVTPPGGVVLDPFTGSGTTGMAALLEGFGFVGVEREPEYLEIAKARVSHALEAGHASVA
jgi:hypothetical protein